jgi:lipoyl(octanoyl) transferase
MTSVDDIAVRRLGQRDYVSTLERMRAFTAARTDATPDELWLLQHPAVYTLGQGTAAVAVPAGIPLVRSDRGGAITYHGPGQVVLYALVDLARRGIAVKRHVALLEQAAIDLLGGRGERRPGAPGVYVAGAKVAALGIRVRRGCAYHGLSLNVDMDLAPFRAIDPCGYPGLAVTQLKDLGLEASVDEAGEALVQHFMQGLENA